MASNRRRRSRRPKNTTTAVDAALTKAANKVKAALPTVTPTPKPVSLARSARNLRFDRSQKTVPEKKPVQDWDVIDTQLVERISRRPELAQVENKPRKKRKPREPVQSGLSLKKPKFCKSRPTNNKSKGGGSKAFAPWC